MSVYRSKTFNASDCREVLFITSFTLGSLRSGRYQYSSDSTEPSSQSYLTYLICLRESSYLFLSDQANDLFDFNRLLETCKLFHLILFGDKFVSGKSYSDSHSSNYSKSLLTETGRSGSLGWTDSRSCAFNRSLYKLNRFTALIILFLPWVVLSSSN